MFGRIRTWFKMRKARKSVDEFFAFLGNPIGRGRQPVVREFEGEDAHVINLLLKGCPHLVIVSNGRVVTSVVHNLSRVAFRQALIEMAKNQEFRDILTDIVIDINTEYK